MTRATFVTNVYVPDPLVQVVQPSPVQVTVIMEKSPGRRAGIDASSILSCGYRPRLSSSLFL